MIAAPEDECTALPSPLQPLPGLEEALASRHDVWGLAAIRQPGGPSYDFFARLLPPLRYVNAAFRHYPIVLSAPGAENKARLTSNGSGLNARAALNSWKEVGVPVSFRLGDGHEAYGDNLRELVGPHLERGYLPIVKMSYEHHGALYALESFAGVDSPLADWGVVFVRFTLAKGSAGKVFAVPDTLEPLLAASGELTRSNGAVLAWFDARWKWEEGEKRLVAELKRGQAAVLAIATKPISPTTNVSAGSPAPSYLRNPVKNYDRRHREAVQIWQSLLDRAAPFEVPERYVNEAEHALLLGLFTLMSRDRLNYSAGNIYERQFEAECGDAAGALLLYGFQDDVRRLLPPLLDYKQEGLGFHDAAFKLQLLSQYFWLTRDSNFMAAARERWQREVHRIVDKREASNGLLPRENYCGDIPAQVYSLNSNANGWRALRDLSAAVEAAGLGQAAQEWAGEASSFRKAILTAVAKSERPDARPWFIPLALFGEEKPYETLTASNLGSYWNLMAPYIIGSGVFGPGSERERAIIDYLHERGGICMGMIRFHQHSGLFANEDALDDLYSLRYTLKLLQLDQVDRALVSFYGKLAQGLTRDTFIGAEGTGLRPLDEFGRPMYLPPNCTAQANFLWMLRYLLVQDWDLDDDGRPETLRLCFATPRAWLGDGETIKVDNAPTAFGPVSLRIQSKLSRGEVRAELTLPTRNPPAQTFLRLRLPEGWRPISARVSNTELKLDESGTMNISHLKGKLSVHVRVIRRQGYSIVAGLNGPAPREVKP